MTAPSRNPINDRSPTTAFAGASPFALKPIREADLAALHAEEPTFDVNTPVPNGKSALIRRATAALPSLVTAQPTAKSS